MKTLLILCLGLAFTAALHLELSNRFIANLLEGEKDVLNGMINTEWQKHGLP